MTEADWVWCGYAGHFIASPRCFFHLHTRVGRWRISTVGDYRPRGEDFPPETMGAGPELYESMVFPVSGYGTHGEGDVTKWEEERTVRYMTAEEACVGHLELCREFAQRDVSDDG